MTLNIHEYQAKEILSRNGVAVPKGRIAFTLDEVEAGAKEFRADNDVCVVKAQILLLNFTRTRSLNAGLGYNAFEAFRHDFIKGELTNIVQ